MDWAQRNHGQVHHMVSSAVSSVTNSLKASGDGDSKIVKECKFGSFRDAILEELNLRFDEYDEYDFHIDPNIPPSLMRKICGDKKIENIVCIFSADFDWNTGLIISEERLCFRTLDDFITLKWAEIENIGHSKSYLIVNSVDIHFENYTEMGVRTIEDFLRKLVDLAEDYHTESVEDKSETSDVNGYDVCLLSSGADKIAVIKEVRALLNLGLKDAKDIVDKCPCLLRKNLDKQQALSFCETLSKAGADAEVYVSNNED
jgi:ribosomal protein L7/L12